MNILINLGTLKKGGGQNVALNFLNSLLRITNINNFHFSIVRNTEIHNFFIKNKLKNFILVPSNPLLRIIYELTFGKILIHQYKVDIIYSYFGICLYSNKIPQITGSADSNLYFPEINFWKDYKGLSLLLRNIVDNYRIWGLHRCKGIIFENEALEKRCHQIFKIKETKFIKPSIFFNKNYTKEFELGNQVNKKIPIGLFLSGWQLNKNIMIIPEIAKLLKDKNIKFQFIITAPKDKSKEHLLFEKKINHYDVQEMIHIVGPVNKEKLGSLYKQIDLVFLLSKLESFSNNIIEAWTFQKLLIVADEPWSKSICKDGAVYVNRESKNDILVKIIQSIKNNKMKDKIILNGKRILSSYPRIDKRTKQELNYIRYIYENY